MKARVVQIGNSRGIRLPKAVIDQAHLSDEVQIDVEPNRIIIRSAHAPREGWKRAFRLMAERGDDVLTEPESLTSFDDEEWTW